MDDVAIRAHGGQVYHWHRSGVSRVDATLGLPTIGLGNEVVCHVGRKTVGSRKMSEPKNYKGEHGIVVITYVHTDTDDLPDDVELAVMLGRGIVWFVPEQLELVPDIREADHAC